MHNPNLVEWHQAIQIEEHCINCWPWLLKHVKVTKRKTVKLSQKTKKTPQLDASDSLDWIQKALVGQLGKFKKAS
jgi:hypothetical protein